jgi:molecular chaperone GrpE (heat shock protein)
MTDRSATKLAFWPFVLVDIIFLALAYFIFTFAHRPLTAAEAAALIVCAAIGAWSFLTPFLRRNEAELKFAQSDRLADTVAQIKNLEQIAAQISGSSTFIKTALDESAQTVTKSQQIGEKMAAEGRAFAEFIQKANDTEKAYLRLEVEKLRRGEADWVQVLVHTLDQVFALHQAALRSSKPGVAEQIGNFQHVCRDIARRVGLSAVGLDGDGKFDEKLHQLAEGQAAPEPGTPLELLAPGYTYQGRMIRRALIRAAAQLQKEVELASTAEVHSVEVDSAEETEPAQNQPDSADAAPAQPAKSASDISARGAKPEAPTEPELF